ncbi:Uncharacterized protein Rs2_45410 [Raphanus sativus]|nr:Uncharacterized protein Rs2_45410 [Raphanus sativus]
MKITGSSDSVNSKCEAAALSAPVKTGDQSGVHSDHKFRRLWRRGRSWQSCSAERMRSKRPYIALNHRLEIDVWPDLACQLMKGKLADVCTLNASEVTKRMNQLLRVLGAPSDARIYWARGEPLEEKK